MERMFMSTIRGWTLILIGLIALSLMSQVSTASAQESTQAPPEPALVVIPERSAEAIQKDIDNTTVTRGLAVDRRVLAQERLRSVDPMLESKKLQLSGLDRRKDEAKRAKRESELIAIEAEKRAGKQVVDLLNRLKELRKTEVETAEAETQLAEAQLKVYELELELSKKRADLAAAQGSSGALNQGAASQVVNDLTARLLKLQEEEANATQKLASKQKDIVTRRLNLFKAQVKLGAA